MSGDAFGPGYRAAYMLGEANGSLLAGAENLRRAGRLDLAAEARELADKVRELHNRAFNALPPAAEKTR